MSTALQTLTTKLATRLDMGDNGRELIDTLKATAFKGQVTDAQMTALMVVANQYGLNPWTREIYAFPDKQNGIVPVVGVDGWSRIINEHDQFDGMEFEQDDTSCTCRIYRKDRGRPVTVTEYLSECKRNTGPWQSHPKRMLRHKAMIQCARLAFGYVGINDPDEAEAIIEQRAERDMGPAVMVDKGLPHYTHEQLQENLPKWLALIESGRKTPDEIIALVSSKYELSKEQKEAIRGLVGQQEEPPVEDDTHEPIDGELV